MYMYTSTYVCVYTYVFHIGHCLTFCFLIYKRLIIISPALQPWKLNIWKTPIIEKTLKIRPLQCSY